MLRLHVQPPEGPPFERLLDRDILVIGRGAGVDLVIPDPFLSRHHARLVRDGTVWRVEDLGSRNGTLVDGVRIATATPVRAGSVLTLSGSRVELQDTAPSEEAAPAGAETPPEALQATLIRPATEVLAAQVAPPPRARRGDETLRRQAERLHLLNEVHRVVGRAQSVDELLGLILDRAFAHLEPEEAVIYLRRQEGGFARAAARSGSGASAAPLLDSRTLLDQVAVQRHAALVLDARSDQRFAAAESMAFSGVRSLVAAPLLDEEESLGMIVVGSRVTVRRFSAEDLELLVSLASVAALRLRNLELAQEAAERRRLETELMLARRIQVTLLPERPPEIAGWEIHTGNLPSRGVSGDFYQVQVRGDGSEAVVLVADVAGKGVSASLLTATLEALAAGPLEEGRPPQEVCSILNRQLYRRTPPERYATLFLATLEVATGALAWVSAGHSPALLARAGGAIEPLGATGVPLGLTAEAEYAGGRAELGPGDLLVVYTDGVVEAADPRGDLYGQERLETLCRTHREAPLPELAAALERDLGVFAGGQPFDDDRTVVLLRRVRGA